jgi:hypothetical protein
MTRDSKTYVVECYLPGVDDAAVRRSADDAAAAARRLGGSRAGIEYLGALLMAVDEVVLHAFRAADPQLVRRASTAAGLPFDRIVESVEVLPAPLIRPSNPLWSES